MHLGTSTAFILAFSFFGDLCGPKKPPEPPPPAADFSENDRQNFARMHEMLASTFKESLPRIELLEAEYQDQDQALNAKGKAMATYPVVVKQHDELIARTETLKAAYASWEAYFEEHKQSPENEHQRKLNEDGQKAGSEANKISSDYVSLTTRLRQIAAQSR